MIERRKNRSESPPKAAALFLAAAAAGSGARAVALASEEGALVAGVGPGHDLAQLAALGAGLGGLRGEAPSPAAASAMDHLTAQVAGDEDLYASRLRVGDATLYLASVGARVPRQRDLAAGLGRILGRWNTAWSNRSVF